jgi:hypothetical protein
MNGLDMDGYIRLGKRRYAFDDWLRAEGLIDQSIFYVCFDEGFVEAKCYDDPRRLTQEGEVAWAWRRFQVSTPPPLVPSDLA